MSMPPFGRDQADVTAAYLLSHTPGAAWQMSCEALEVLGHAVTTDRGARLFPVHKLPTLLPARMLLRS